MSNRVMIVEDEPALRKFAEKILEDDGNLVITVPDAKTAKAVYKEGMFDCMVVDFLLGTGETGIDLIRDIRDKDKKIGIVMVTGTVDLTELAVDGLGVWSCLRKPYEAETLIEKVSEACELSHMDAGKIESLGTRMEHQTGRLKELRADLRNETTVLPPGAMRSR